MMRYMALVCCITNGTNTHSECVIGLRSAFFFLQQCLYKHPSVLHYADVACLVLDQLCLVKFKFKPA